MCLAWAFSAWAGNGLEQAGKSKPAQPPACSTAAQHFSHDTSEYEIASRLGFFEDFWSCLASLAGGRDVREEGI